MVHQADGPLANLSWHIQREEVVVIRGAPPWQHPLQPNVQLGGWYVEQGECIQSACWVVQAGGLQAVGDKQGLVSRSVPHRVHTWCFWDAPNHRLKV